MPRYRGWSHAGACVALLLPACTTACSVSSYVAFSDVHWLPFGWWDESTGDILGFHKDLTVAMCQTKAFAGVRCDMVRDSTQKVWYDASCDEATLDCVSFPGDAILEESYDAALLELTAERWAAYDFSNTIADVSELYMLVKHGHVSPVPASGEGEIFVVVDGHAINAHIKSAFPRASIMLVPSVKQQMDILLNETSPGRHVVIQPAAVATRLLQREQGKLQLYDTTTVLSLRGKDRPGGQDIAGKIALAFKKGREGTCRKEMVNAALKELRASGRGAEICSAHPSVTCTFTQAEPFLLRSASVGSNATMSEENAGCKVSESSATVPAGNRNPQFSWSGPPRDTKSFALISKPNSTHIQPGHWAVYNIPSSWDSIAEGSLAAGTVKDGVLQSAGGYEGPCPPSNLGEQTFTYTLYALDVADLGLQSGTARADVEAALAGHILAEASISPVYSTDPDSCPPIRSYAAYTDVEWAPFESWNDSTGAFAGFHADLTAAMCGTSAFNGVTCAMVRDDWQSIWYQADCPAKNHCNHYPGPGVISGYYDSVIMQINPERNAAYRYGTPLADGYRFVAVARVDHLRDHTTFPSDGSGETFVFIEGYADNKKISLEFPNAHVVLVKTQKEQLDMLLAAAPNASIVLWQNAHAAKAIVDQNNAVNAGTDKELKIIGHPTDTLDGWNLNKLHGTMPGGVEGMVALAFNQDRRGLCVRNMVERALAILNDTGAGAQLCEKYPLLQCMFTAGTGTDTTPQLPPPRCETPGFIAYSDVMYAPFEGWNESTGELQGFHKDLFDGICSTTPFQGVGCGIAKDNWDSVWHSPSYPGPGLLGDYYDTFVGPITPETAAAFDFTAPIADGTKLVAVANAGSGAISPDGAGHVFVTVLDSAAVQLLRTQYPAATFESAADTAEAVTKLTANGVIWASLTTVHQLLASNPRLVVLGHPAMTLKGGMPNEGMIAFGFKKSWRGQCLKAMVERALAEMSGNGRLNTICGKYPAVNCAAAAAGSPPPAVPNTLPPCNVTSYVAYTDVDWAPYEGWNKLTGSAIGFHSDLTKLLCSTVAFHGVECKLLRDSWSQVWKRDQCGADGSCTHSPGEGILSGSYDSVLMQINPERLASFSYSIALSPAARSMAVARRGHGNIDATGANHTFILRSEYADNVYIQREFPNAVVEYVVGREGQVARLLAAEPGQNAIAWMHTDEAAEVVRLNNADLSGTKFELELIGHPVEADGWDLKGKHGTIAGEGSVALAFRRDRRGECRRQLVETALQELQAKAALDPLCIKYPLVLRETSPLCKAANAALSQGAFQPPALDWPAPGQCDPVASYLVYSDVDWAPFEAWDESAGVAVGFHADLTRAICGTKPFRGVKCQLVRDRWQKIWYEAPCNRNETTCLHYPGPGLVEPGYYDAAIMQVNTERWMAFDFSTTVAGGHNFVAVAKADHAHDHTSFPVDGAGEIFILINGYAMNANIVAQFPKATVVSAADQKEQLKKLLEYDTGAGVVLWQNVHTAQQMVDANPGLKVIGHPEDTGAGWDFNSLWGTMPGNVEGTIALGFRKDAVGSCKRKMVNEALKELEKSGQMWSLCQLYPAVNCKARVPRPEKKQESCSVKSFTVYTDVDWFPFESWNDITGDAVGFHKELVDLVCATQSFKGIQCKMVRDSWPTIWYVDEKCTAAPCQHFPGDGLQAHRYDAALMQVNPERWAAFDFSEVLLEGTKFLPVARADHTSAITSDGSGNTFILIKGYADNQFISSEFPRAKLLFVEDGEGHLQALLRAKQEDNAVLWENADAARKLVESHNAGDSTIKLKLLGHPVDGEAGWDLRAIHGRMPDGMEGSVAWGFAKDASGNCVRDAVARALQEIRASGLGVQLCYKHRLLNCVFTRQGTVAAYQPPTPPTCNVESYTAYSDVEWAPFEAWDESTGEFTGFHKELTEALCATTAFSGVRCEMVRDVWANIWYEKPCDEKPCNHYPGPGIPHEFYDSVLMQVNSERQAAFTYGSTLGNPFKYLAIARASHRHNHLSFPADGEGETFQLIHGWADNIKIQRQFPKATYVSSSTSADEQVAALYAAPPDAAMVLWQGATAARKLLQKYNEVLKYNGTDKELKIIGHRTDPGGFNLNQGDEGKVALAFRKDFDGTCKLQLVERALNEMRSGGASSVLATLCGKYPAVDCASLTAGGSVGSNTAPAPCAVSSYTAYSDVEWAPFEAWDEVTGAMTGFHKDLTDLLCKTPAFRGVRCKMVRDNWQSVWTGEYAGRGMNAEHYDSAIMQINPQRSAAFYFADPIASALNFVAVARVGHRHNHSSFPQDGAGETFVLIKGYADNVKIEKQFTRATYQYVVSQSQQLSALAAAPAGASIVLWQNHLSAQEMVQSVNKNAAGTDQELRIIGHPIHEQSGWDLNRLHGTMPNEGKVTLAFKKNRAGYCAMDLVSRAMQEIPQADMTALCAKYPAVSCEATATPAPPTPPPTPLPTTAEECVVSSFVAYTDVEWAPFEAWNLSSGLLTGFHKDLHDAICATEVFQGIECGMVRSQWQDIWYSCDNVSTGGDHCPHYPGPGLQVPYFDTSIMQINSERWASFAFGDVVANGVRFIAVAQVGHGLGSAAFPVDGEGETFILINGYGETEKIMAQFPKARIEHVESAPEQLKMLMDAPSGARIVLWRNLDNAKELVYRINSERTDPILKLIGHPTDGDSGWDLNSLQGKSPNEGKVAFAFKRDSEGNCKRQLVNRAMAELRTKGGMKTICDRYPAVECVATTPPATHITTVTPPDDCSFVKSYTAYSDVAWAPFEAWNSSNGKMVGFHKELTDLMCATEAFKNIECRMVRDSWDRVWKRGDCNGGVCNHYPGESLYGGHADASIMQINPERWAAYDFSVQVSPAMRFIAIAWAAHNHNHDSFPVDGEGETFVLVESYGNVGPIKRQFPKATVTLVKTLEEQASMLLQSPEDSSMVIWRNVKAANEFLTENADKALKLIGHPVEQTAGWDLHKTHGSMPNGLQGVVALGFKKDREGSCKRRMVNSALAELKANGKGRSLCDKYPLTACDLQFADGAVVQPPPPKCDVRSYTAYTDVEWDPFESWDAATGELVGFHKSLTEAICSTPAFANVKCNMVNDDWTSVWYPQPCDETKGACPHWPGPGLQAGYYDSVLMQITPERAAAFDYSDVVTSGLVFVPVARVTHNHNELTFPSDGAGETFVVRKGYGENALIKAQFTKATYVEVDSDALLVDALMKAEPTASIVFWTGLSAAADIVEAHNLKHPTQKLKVIGNGWDLNALHGKMPDQGKVALAFKKDFDGACKRELVNLALKQLIAHGDAAKLCQQFPAVDCSLPGNDPQAPPVTLSPTEAGWTPASCKVQSLTFFTDVTWIPLEGWEPSGEVTGFQSDLLKMGCSAQGLRCNLVRDSWNSVWETDTCTANHLYCGSPGPGLQGGYYDAALAEITPARYSSYLFSDVVAGRQPRVGVVNKDYSITSDALTTDGEGLTMVLDNSQNDYDVIMKQFPKASPVRVPDWQGQLRQIQTNQYIAWMTRARANELLAGSHGSELRMLGHQDDSWDVTGQHGTMPGDIQGKIAFMFKKDWAGMCARDAVNKMLADLKATGRGRYLCDQYPLVGCVFSTDTTTPRPSLPHVTPAPGTDGPTPSRTSPPTAGTQSTSPPSSRLHVASEDKGTPAAVVAAVAVGALVIGVGIGGLVMKTRRPPVLAREGREMQGVVTRGQGGPAPSAAIPPQFSPRPADGTAEVPPTGAAPCSGPV